MSDGKNPLVDYDDVDATAYQPWDKAFTGHGFAGDVGGAFNLLFTEGEGTHNGDFKNPNTGKYIDGSGWLSGLPLADDTFGYAQALADCKTGVIDRLEQGQWPDPTAIIEFICSAAGVAGDILAAGDPASLPVQYVA